jgi:transposase
MGELRGRKEGEQRILTEKEELEIKEFIVKQIPEDLGLGAALWTRRKIQELIKKETKHKFPLNTVGNHMYRWGLTAQRPGKRAYEQDDEKIRKWTEEEYPKIVKKANKEKATIKFSDETGISLNAYYGKSYALKGKTPRIKLPTVRTHISMISSVSRGGALEFSLYRKGLDSDKFIDFLEKQVKHATKKIYLIVDNLRVHKSKKVLAWAREHKTQIELFFSTSLRPTIQSS